MYWMTAKGQLLDSTEMTTSHLLNVHAHLLNNYKCYMQMFLARFADNEPKVRARLAQNTFNEALQNVQQELLSRNISFETILAHGEDTSYLKEAVSQLRGTSYEGT